MKKNSSAPSDWIIMLQPEQNESKLNKREIKNVTGQCKITNM